MNKALFNKSVHKLQHIVFFISNTFIFIHSGFNSEWWNTTSKLNLFKAALYVCVDIFVIHLWYI